MDDDIPYLLLTPGPLTTSKSVKQVMLADFCTWDDDYNNIVTDIRQRMVRLATAGDDAAARDYTAVLMQGSGTFSVEATIGSAIQPGGKLLVINNGAYGKRIAQIAERLRIAHTELAWDETLPPDLDQVEHALRSDAALTHVAMVHCETTTGMLNPVAEVGRLANQYGKSYIVDAMSSLGGVPLAVQGVGAQWIVTSANKCVQGVPGFGIVVAQRQALERSKGFARSLSLDLYDQWHEMETKGGKWRYTSPTHTVRAFAQALDELDAEGGVAARHRRYCENHRVLVEGYEALGFHCLLPAELRSPIITSFVYPADSRFTFNGFYEAMKRRRFVLYPGKVSRAETFRVGTIGHVFPDDFRQLVSATGAAIAEMGVRLG